MGKRKRVKGNTNMNGNGKTSISSTSMKMSRGRNQATDNKLEGGGNESKKMKRGQSSNTSSVKTGDGQSQSQELSANETSTNNFPPENTNEEPSTSSSYSYWTRSRKEDPELKELELARNREIDEPAAVDELTEGQINNLPPEMLTEILKCVDSRSLFDCRLVRRQWLEISSEILTNRTDSVLSFKDYDFKRVAVHQGPLKNTKSNKLQEFVNRMKKCKNCPFARFSFDFESPSFFDQKDWIQFLSIFAPSKNVNTKQNPNQRSKIKYMKFYWCKPNYKTSLLLFTEKLRDLLLNKIPHLEELCLHFSWSRDDFKDVKLFPPGTNAKVESTTTTTTFPVPLQLPCLKVLEIKVDMVLDFPGIIRDLLNAAVNLTKINMDGICFDEEAFQFLYSLGKLHLVKQLEITMEEDFFSDVGNSTKHEPSKLDFSLAFKIQELKLYAFSNDIDEEFYADTTNFLSTLLESSKDTLEKLEMSPLGYLPGLQFPKFTKLKTLSTNQYNGLYLMLEEPLFPPGIRSISREIFPAVENLEIATKDWERAFPQEDSIPIFPSVHTFCFNDEELKESVIAKLASMCPNLKHFVIQTGRGNPEQFNFAQVGRSIWIHLKQLESLEVDVDVNLENHASPALDSCFTGISTENCQRLQELMEAEKTRNKSKSQVQLPESEELKKLTQREHPSILDMKRLKKLVINRRSGKKRHDWKNFFTTKITWISEEFAFKLMPHLQFNGRRPSTRL